MINTIYLWDVEPKLIDLKDYELSGGGKLGESYIKRDDSDVLLKLYPLNLKQMGIDEYDRASKVYSIGIPCPAPGEPVTTADGRIGLLFKRIQGKKSYARATSEHPELVEQYAAEFAAMCRQLHSVKPQPGLFSQAKDQYIQGIKESPFLTHQERIGLERFIRTLPDAQTALHGDLHYGNAIFSSDGKKYFIDLSEFCIGTPLFDIGIFYLQTKLIPDEIVQELYHMDKSLAIKFWNAFVKAYFGPDAQIETIEEMVKPYALLRILLTEQMLGHPNPFIRPAIHRMINI